MRYNLSYIDGVPLEGEGFASAQPSKETGWSWWSWWKWAPRSGDVLKHLGIPSNVQVIFYVFFFLHFRCMKNTVGPILDNEACEMKQWWLMICVYIYIYELSRCLGDQWHISTFEIGLWLMTQVTYSKGHSYIGVTVDLHGDPRFKASEKTPRNRLRFTRLSGRGPYTGWVDIKDGKRDLLYKVRWVIGCGWLEGTSLVFV